MTNKNNSHIFYYKPSEWIWFIMFITYCVQMEMTDTFLLVNKWYWLCILIAICFYPIIKVDKARIQKFVLFGLYPYRTALWKNVNEHSLDDGKYRYVLLSLKTEKQRIDTRYKDYLSSEKLVRTVFAELKDKNSYTKNAKKERKFEIAMVIIQLILFSVFFYYAWFRNKLEMKHINIEETFFWFSSFWYAVAFIVFLFLIAHFLEKFIKSDFSEEVASFISIIVFLISGLGFVVFPTYTQFENEQNIDVPVMHKIKLMRLGKTQTWQPQDFKIASKTFKLKWFDEQFINKNLKEGKTYLMPVYEGKYKDYFLPKDAFLKATLATDRIQNK